MVACAAGIAVLFTGSVAVVHRATRLDEPAAPRDEGAGAAAAARAAVAAPPSPATAAGTEVAPRAPGPAGVAEAPAAPEPASAPAALAAAAAVRISFQMDPRLTQGLHMGERWVSPPRYTRTLDATGVGLHARARVLDAQGKPLEGAPGWASARPDVLAVWPALGSAVAFIPRREGRTTVKVTAGRASRELTVTAARQGGGWRVDVSQ